jgi:hypothetical protein
MEKYDGSTNPVDWLEVRQLTIKATSGDSYVMANYLNVFVIIRQDIALRASYVFSSFLEPLMPAAHQ